MESEKRSQVRVKEDDLPAARESAIDGDCTYLNSNKMTMKKKLLSFAMLPVFLAFAGCGQKEEPAVETAQAEAVKATETASEEVETVESQTENSLVAATDALKKAVPDLEKQVESMSKEVESMPKDSEMKAAAEAQAAEVEEIVVVETAVAEVPDADEVVVTKEVAVMEVEVPEAAEAEEDSMMSKALGAAGGMVSGLDLSNLSWETVSEVPYNDKAALLAWATQQASTWRSKLTDAAMDQGTSLLNNLGDSGWQGSLKKVMDALDGVREASPETWQMARGALVSAWENFETQATAYLSKG
jgi:outer membrane lipopolysaccharide assembly protein LptE/RlpB